MGEPAGFYADNKLYDSLGSDGGASNQVTVFAFHHDQRPASQTLLIHQGGRVCESVIKTASGSRGSLCSVLLRRARDRELMLPLASEYRGQNTMIQFKFPGHPRRVQGDTLCFQWSPETLKRSPGLLTEPAESNFLFLPVEKRHLP